MGNNSNDKIKKVAEFAQGYLKTSAKKNEYSRGDYKFRWQHSLRTANYAKRIAVEEGADVEIVIIACLLHDICKFNTKKGENHGWKAAQVSRHYLNKLGYSEKQINNVCYSIASHVNGNADFKHPHTLEAKAVWDADKIDKYGTFSILNRTFFKTKHLKKSIKKLREKINNLTIHIKKGNMQTETGEKMIRAQLQRQLKLYKYLQKDKSICKIPEI